MLDTATSSQRGATNYQGSSRRRQTPSRRRAPERRSTVEEWLRIPEDHRAELIQGRIVYHTCPGVRHGDTQAQISRVLYPYRRRRTGGGGGGGAGPGAELGGWWLSQEVDLLIGDIGCRPDVVGWRRDKYAKAPEPDARGVITLVPDFLCEVMSKSTARYDQGEKRDAYFRAGVPYYWLVDPDLRTLTVLERTDRGYLILSVTGPGDTVRAAPFEGVEIVMDDLFLDEEGELAQEEPEEKASAQPVAAEKPKKRAASRAASRARKKSPPKQ